MAQNSLKTESLRFSANTSMEDDIKKHLTILSEGNDALTPVNIMPILNAVVNIAGFADVTGATSSSYQPGALNETTWCKRLVKADCKCTWRESNVVEITVVAAITWTSTTSTDRYTAANRSPSVVPTATADATIPTAGVTNCPVVGSSTNTQVKNLTHEGTSTKRITVNSGGSLTLNGTHTTLSGSEIKVICAP